jgi:hypothetical protein
MKQEYQIENFRPMETMRMFKCSPCCKKLVHRWRHRMRLPDVKEIP